MRKTKMIVHVIMIFCLAISFALFWVEPIIDSSHKKDISQGHPQKNVTESLHYFNTITDFAVAGEYVYILFDSNQEMMCCDKDGNYLHSYYYKQYTNGGSRLYRNGNKVYLQDRRYNIYIFENAEFVEFLEAESEEISSLKKDFDSKSEQKSDGAGGCIYEKWGSICYKTDNTHKEIFSRPFWTSLLHHGRPIFGFVFCAVCLILTKRLKQSG